MAIRGIAFGYGTDDGAGGGCIRSDDAELLLENVGFGKCEAQNGGAILSVDAGEGGSLHVVGSTFVGNSATDHGGAIHATSRLTVTNSTFDRNDAGQNGGAIHSGTSDAARAVVIEESKFDMNTSGSTGGGVYVDRADLTVTGSTIVDNRAASGGGGLWTGGKAHLEGTTIQGNTVSGQHANGAGVGASSLSDMTLVTSLVSSNTMTGQELGYGGGIHTEGKLTCRDSTIRGNHAGAGGGVAATGDQHQLEIDRCTLSGNMAAGGAGGVLIDGATGKRNSLRNSTVAGNTALEGAGLLVRGGGSTWLTFSTISKNTATHVAAGGVAVIRDAIVYALGSIIADNTAATGGQDIVAFSGGSLDSRGYNAIGSSTASGIPAEDFMDTDRVGTDQVPLDPRLGPLTDNGGPTETMLPEAASLVVDYVPRGVCEINMIGTDQRGIQRTASHGLCDVGSVERTDAD